MECKSGFIKRMTQQSELSHQLPGIPLVEIAGDRRVLIENYHSVLEYGSCGIVCKVKYGKILINGNDLELKEMKKEKLVICGRIASVTIHREGGESGVK